MLNQSEYLDLIVRYLNNPQDKLLRDEIASFRAESLEHECYFQEVERIWEFSSKSARLSLLNPNEATHRFRISLKAITQRRSVWPKWVGGIAASILLIGIGLQLFNPNKNAALLTVKTISGQTDTVLLADGSQVILAENSELKYPARFTTETRDVNLSNGRAFFQITKDPKHAFRVHMGESRVSVLGTSFNLTYSNVKIDLDVKTGRVMFLPYKNAVSSILSAGQGLSYQIVQKQFIDRASQNSDSWITKELTFVDTPLDEVCRQLSNCYEVEIVFSAGKRIDKKFNASFKQEDLGVILQVLQQTYNLKIKKEGTKLTLIAP